MKVNKEMIGEQLLKMRAGQLDSMAYLDNMRERMKLVQDAPNSDFIPENPIIPFEAREDVAENTRKKTLAKGKLEINSIQSSIDQNAQQIVELQETYDNFEEPKEETQK